ncbi:extracellular solute-binding protein [Labrys monachus]|uniref:Microcin C transport system substrate-binding protein n=1 Tax=Labrys monachus TaxID=217067 RepID=A0ABU0FQ05_9HYPH|nr:extracellular solute-binding protein [Labrys monachus]MDQ0396138.1 microcin C transport system substrate-binding protein [Labrys monachus]
MKSHQPPSIPLDRRTLLKAGFAGAASALLPAGARGAEIESHGLSSFGDLKYPPGFKAFAYVRPDAPKGGVFSQQLSQTIYNQGFNTFDSLHIYILKGDGAAGMDACFATLLARAWDEPDAMYGYAAQSVAVSADRLTYRFRLRPGLSFHDGSPLTAADCAWSFNTLKAQGHPYLGEALRAFVEAVAEAPDLVRVTLAPGRGRDLPLVVAGLPIFSKAWWAGRDFGRSSLDVPLGSGPYKVGRVAPGQAIAFERVTDWWGAALPSQVGSHNFDRLVYEYYRDRASAFLGFTARNFLFREEVNSINWATGYNFPAAKDGRVRRESVPDYTPSGAQGWHFNTRRDKFADPRVRRAIGMALDFEWTNKSIMFSSYQRTTSIFENSPLKATGLPSSEERAILEEFRGKVPEAAFGEAVLPPVSDGSGADRALLQAAGRLLAEAGWTVIDRARRNAKGEALTVEFLDDSDALLKHTQPFIQNLGRLGIAASYRIVDAAQYQLRTDNFDYDVMGRRVSFDLTPGEGMRGYFSSRAAAMPGSLNAAGIADPVVDALIDRIVAAQSRAELTTLCRVLDRVLRAGYYWVPQWFRPNHWLAYWDLFERRDPGVIYMLGATELWWSKG